MALPLPARGLCIEAEERGREAFGNDLVVFRASNSKLMKQRGSAAVLLLFAEMTIRGWQPFAHTTLLLLLPASSLACDELVGDG